MSAVLATLNRELRAYFLSPLAYVVLFFFLMVNGITFTLLVGYLNDPLRPAGRPMDFFFGQTLLFWLILLFVAPVLTMRLLAEERKSGSVEVLMTAPVSELQVVLGKYLASLTFYVFLWLPTATYALLIAGYSDVDWGPVAAGYLGILGIGALFLSAGLFASAMSRNQIVAAILTFALLFGLLVVSFLEGLLQGPIAQEVLGYLNLWRHMDDFAKGIVDTRPLVYYLSGTIFFLLLAAQALERKKWRS